MTYFLGFFLGPGLPLTLESPLTWPRARLAAAAEPLPFLPFGVDASAPGAGVLFGSDAWSIESVVFKAGTSFDVAAGDCAVDDGVLASAGNLMPAIAASFCLGTRNTMNFCFFAIVVEVVCSGRRVGKGRLVKVGIVVVQLFCGWSVNVSLSLWR